MFNNKYLLILSMITLTSLLCGMENISEETKKLISLYKENYKAPSKEFIKQHVIPLDKAKNDHSRMIFLNAFIYNNIKWTLENDSTANNMTWINHVTDQTEEKAKIRPALTNNNDKMIRKAEEEIILCKYLNLSYLLYAGMKATKNDSNAFWQYARRKFTGNRLDKTTIETIFGDMRHHLSVRHAMKFDRKIRERYAEKIAENNDNYVSPLEVEGVTLKHALEAAEYKD